MESTEGTRLPLGESDRVFALVRRWTMRTASLLRLGVVDASNEVVAKVDLMVASPGALVALKQCRSRVVPPAITRRKSARTFRISSAS